MAKTTAKSCNLAVRMATLILSAVSRSLALWFACFAVVLMACSSGDAKPIQYKACDGQLAGPNSKVGKFDMPLGSDTAIINPANSNGLDACFFYVGTPVGKAILSNCSVGHRCLVAGGVQSVRGVIGNDPRGPAVNVLTEVITAVDITAIEEQAIKGCKDKN